MKIDNQTKLEYYDIMNSIKMEYLKSNIPFNIVNNKDIKLSYKEIQLKYVDDKNYFVKVSKKPFNKPGQFNNFNPRNVPNIDMTKPWTKEKREEYRKNKEHEQKSNQPARGRSKSPRHEFTPEETAAYLERKQRRESHSRSPDRSKSPRHEFTPEETAAYLERKKRRESHSRSPDRSKSPRHEFTPEETASYLERKNRREKHGGSKIQVFY
jgi:hypothetical protein